MRGFGMASPRSILKPTIKQQTDDIYNAISRQEGGPSRISGSINPAIRVRGGNDTGREIGFFSPLRTLYAKCLCRIPATNGETLAVFWPQHAKPKILAAQHG